MLFMDLEADELFAIRLLQHRVVLALVAKCRKVAFRDAGTTHRARPVGRPQEHMLAQRQELLKYAVVEQARDFFGPIGVEVGPAHITDE